MLQLTYDFKSTHGANYYSRYTIGKVHETQASTEFKIKGSLPAETLFQYTVLCQIERIAPDGPLRSV